MRTQLNQQAGFPVPSLHLVFVWKCLLFSWDLSCLALRCRKVWMDQKQGWPSTSWGWAVVQQLWPDDLGLELMGCQSNFLAGQRTRKPSETRLKPSGTLLSVTASSSHFVLIYWHRKAPTAKMLVNLAGMIYSNRGIQLLHFSSGSAAGLSMSAEYRVISEKADACTGVHASTQPNAHGQAAHMQRFLPEAGEICHWPLFLTSCSLWTR